MRTRRNQNTRYIFRPAKPLPMEEFATVTSINFMKQASVSRLASKNNFPFSMKPQCSLQCSHKLPPCPVLSCPSSLPFRFSDQNFVRISNLLHATCLVCRLIILDVMFLIFTSFPLHSLGQNILFSTLFSNFRNMKYQDSYPFNTTGKIIVL